jgi:nitrogen fixation protein
MEFLFTGQMLEETLSVQAFHGFGGQFVFAGGWRLDFSPRYSRNETLRFHYLGK